MGPKILKYSNNFFKWMFLMHLTYVLRKNSVVEYSYRSVLIEQSYNRHN
jgi:hypothetical protein